LIQNQKPWNAFSKKKKQKKLKQKKNPAREGNCSYENK